MHWYVFLLTWAQQHDDAVWEILMGVFSWFAIWKILWYETILWQNLWSWATGKSNWRLRRETYCRQLRLRGWTSRFEVGWARETNSFFCTFVFSTCNFNQLWKVRAHNFMKFAQIVLDLVNLWRALWLFPPEERISFKPWKSTWIVLSPTFDNLGHPMLVYRVLCRN